MTFAIACLIALWGSSVIAVQIWTSYLAPYASDRTAAIFRGIVAIALAMLILK